MSWLAELLAQPETARALAALSVRDTARADHAAASDDLAAATDARDRAVALVRRRRTELADAHVTSLLDGAYRTGRLIRARDDQGAPLPSPREDRLRRLALGAGGIDRLTAEIASLPVLVPIGQRAVDDKDPQARTSFASAEHDDVLDRELQNVAARTGQDITALRAEAARMRVNRGGRP